MNETKWASERVRADHLAADEQHRRLPEQGQEPEQRHVEGALAVGADASGEQRFRAALELVLLRLLLGERLDDVDADDVLLGHGRDVGHFLLDVAEDRVRDVAVAVGDRDERGREGERDQRELPGDDEQQDANPEDGEDMLEEEDQSVAEEEADALQVDRRARHQLTGLVAVVVAEREPDELRVERVAEVELDGERLVPGDEAPPDRRERLRRTDGDDDPDQQRQAVPLVTSDRRDDVAGQPGEGERA